jgi:hypothetical protein
MVRSKEECMQEVAKIYADFSKEWSEKFHRGMVDVMESPTPFDYSRKLQIADMLESMQRSANKLQEALHDCYMNMFDNPPTD